MKLILRITLLLFCTVTFAQPGNRSDWTVVGALTDEFNGASLNMAKWRFGHPWWKGRSPALFGGAANAFLNNGLLVLRATWVGGPTNYMRAGSIRSAYRTMAPGMYSECNYRTNSLRMGSNFWFAHNARDAQNREDEIDVQEGFGTNAPRTMNFNIHNPKPGFTEDQPQPSKFPVPGQPINVGYHTYGIWIVNSRTINIYLDGRYLKTVISNSTIQPLWMIINTETYNWMRPPTRAEVQNGALRDTYVNYVRTYRHKFRRKDLTDPLNEATQSLVFPNPVSKENPLNIGFKLDKPTKISTALYDVNGKEILINDLGNYEKGEYDIEALKANNNIPAGVYILKTTLNDEVITHKVMFE